MAANLAAPLTDLTGVGPALATKLERLGLYRIEDLLFLLPLRYEDRTQLVKLGALQIGQRCLVTGEVQLAETVYRGRRNLPTPLGGSRPQVAASPRMIGLASRAPTTERRRTIAVAPRAGFQVSLELRLPRSQARSTGGRGIRATT